MSQYEQSLHVKNRTLEQEANFQINILIQLGHLDKWNPKKDIIKDVLMRCKNEAQIERVLYKIKSGTQSIDDFIEHYRVLIERGEW